MTTLLMSSRHTDDDQALWRAAIERDWSVVRARGIQVPEIDDPEIVVYVEALYAAVIVKKIGRKLLDPPEDWLTQVPSSLTQRKIELTTLGAARALLAPTFVKPPNDKSFVAGVFQSGEELSHDFDDDTTVLIAEPVTWLSEFRCFCHNGKVNTISPYLREGELAKHSGFQADPTELRQATEFAEQVLAVTRSTTPDAIVIDVGQIKNRGWAVVEANGAWGSGIYGCDPSEVLDVIRHATVLDNSTGVI